MEGGIVAILCAATSAAATPDGAWPPVVAAYARHPFRERHAVLAFARRSPEPLPPAIAMIAGDAALRAGRTTEATARFDALLASNPGDPWNGWAALALGWIAFAGDRPTEALPHFQAAALAAQSRAAARIAIGLIVARTDADAASELLDATAAETLTPLELRDAALLASGYARFWHGDFTRSQHAFDALAVRDGVLADDARYARAWARIRGGERKAGLDELTALAGDDRSASSTPIRDQVIELEPRALVREGIRRYRHGPFGTPDRQLVTVLDGDGAALARAAIRRLTDPAPAGDRPADPEPARVSSRAHDGRQAADRRAPHAWMWSAFGLLGVAVTALGLRALSRNRSREYERRAVSSRRS